MNIIWAWSLTNPTGIKVVSVTVSTGQTVWTVTDIQLQNGKIIWYYPTSNQDQLVDSVALTAATWVVTVTLAAAATANNVFSVSVALATWNDA